MTKNNKMIYSTFDGTDNNIIDTQQVCSWNSNGTTINNDLNTSLGDELVKKTFLNNFDFSYLEEIFKNCTEEELKLMHANYEHIIKLVEQHYFDKV